MDSVQYDYATQLVRLREAQERLKSALGICKNIHSYEEKYGTDEEGKENYAQLCTDVRLALGYVTQLIATVAPMADMQSQANKR